MAGCSVALVYKENKILFLQRDIKEGIRNPGKWDFVGGVIDGDESPEAALRRELQEEISCVPKHIKYFKTIENREGFGTSAYYFLVLPTEEEIKLFVKGDEGEQLAWKTLEELGELNLVSEERNFLNVHLGEMREAVKEFQKEIDDQIKEEKTEPNLEISLGESMV